MKISVIILNTNDYTMTASLINMIKDYKCLNHIIVVDNNSAGNDYALLKAISSDKIVVLKSPENKGYSFGNNIGINWSVKNTDDEIIAIANSDVEFDEKFVEIILQHFEKEKDYAIFTGVQKDTHGNFASHPFWPNYTIHQYFYQKISELLPVIKSPDFSYSRKMLKTNKEVIDVGAVEGSLFFIRKSDFEKIGFFDDNIFLYNEENIIAKKLAKINRKTGVITNISYIHYGGHSTKSVKNKKILNYYCDSAVYFFNNYMTDNIFLQNLNVVFCRLLRTKSFFASKLKKLFKYKY